MALSEPTFVNDELELLAGLVPLRDLKVAELGCGKAEMLRRMVAEGTNVQAQAFEVDARQHAANLAAPAAGIQFRQGGAQAIDAPAASFDLAMMLKSLHHVPIELMDPAFAELHRVLRPGGLLYVSEPVFAGEFNEVVRLFHDESTVRREAYAAVQRALASGRWQQVKEIEFVTPVKFRDFSDFKRRIIDATYADHRLSDELLARVQGAFEPHVGEDGARFVRPMRVNLLRRA